MQESFFSKCKRSFIEGYQEARRRRKERDELREAEEGNKPRRQRRTPAEWYRYHVLLNKKVALLSALIFSHALVELTETRILVSFLVKEYMVNNLPGAVTTTNIFEGLSAVMMIVVASIADSTTGRHFMVRCSTIVYATGCLLMYLSAQTSSQQRAMFLFHLGMFPMAIGMGTRKPTLFAFLGDQMIDPSTGPSEAARKRAVAQSHFWFNFWQVLAIPIALLLIGNLHYVTIFKIATTSMFIGYVSFESGSLLYQCQKPTGSPVSDIFLVFKVAILNRGLPYPTKVEEFYEHASDELQLSPHIFRWLDKAAIIKSIGKPCPVEKVRKVKLLFSMTPMWATFFVYCIVAATGSAFFILQFNSMDNQIGRFRVPSIFPYIIKNGSKVTVIFVSNFISKKTTKSLKSKINWAISKFILKMIQRLYPLTTPTKSWKFKIGTGMFCAFLTCISARFIEMERLHLFSKDVKMSILWLIPQSILLGMMEGFCEEGLLRLYIDQVPESMKTYGVPFNKFVLGIGRFSSILWILTFKRWFGASLNESHLDNYYAILAILTLANLLFFQYVSCLSLYVGAVDRPEEDDKDEEEILPNRPEDRSDEDEKIEKEMLPIRFKDRSDVVEEKV